jgi:hypothetical protein
MQGQSSVGPMGSLRPAVGDMNADGATDIVLAHGASGTVSIVLNKLSTFATYDAGKSGAGGFKPLLTGTGYTTPGGKIDLSLTQGRGGAPGLLQIGMGHSAHPILAVQTVLVEALIQLGGPLGVPGAGSWTMAGHMPNEVALIGTEVTLQAILVDPAAGAPAQGFSLSNGLSVTIVQ